MMPAEAEVATRWPRSAATNRPKPTADVTTDELLRIRRSFALMLAGAEALPEGRDRDMFLRLMPLFDVIDAEVSRRRSAEERRARVLAIAHGEAA